LSANISFKTLTIGLITICVTTFLFQRCTSESGFSVVPEISFVGLNKDTLRQGSLNTDSLTVVLDFKDGDGDLGIDGQSNVLNVFITDKRTGKAYGNYKIPNIPGKGAGKGIEGRMFINLYNTCCIFPESIPACNSPVKYPFNDLQLEIYIQDRALNKSNIITTSIIKLKCS
jgi:hypothetical protein